MTEFNCPECGGGFDQPVKVTTGSRGITSACPWCGHTSAYLLTANDSDVFDPLERLEVGVGADTEHPEPMDKREIA